MFDTIKAKIAKVKNSKVKDSTPNAYSISKMIQLSNGSKTSSNDTQLVEKNKRFLAFNAILFTRHMYDKNGELRSLLFADLSDKTNEIISSTAFTSETEQDSSGITLKPLPTTFHEKECILA